MKKLIRTPQHQNLKESIKACFTKSDKRDTASKKKSDLQIKSSPKSITQHKAPNNLTMKKKEEPQIFENFIRSFILENIVPSDNNKMVSLEMNIHVSVGENWIVSVHGVCCVLVNKSWSNRQKVRFAHVKLFLLYISYSNANDAVKKLLNRSRASSNGPKL